MRYWPFALIEIVHLCLSVLASLNPTLYTQGQKNTIDVELRIRSFCGTISSINRFSIVCLKRVYNIIIIQHHYRHSRRRLYMYLLASMFHNYFDTRIIMITCDYHSRFVFGKKTEKNRKRDVRIAEREQGGNCI